MAIRVNVTDRTGEAKDAAHMGLTEAVAEAGRRLLDAANVEVPYDEGELEASGQVVTEGTSARVLYTARHAVPQHERMDYRRQAGRAKWLQLALQEQGDQVLEIAGHAIRVRLR